MSYIHQSWVNFLPRKAKDLSELLLLSNTKTASLMRLQGLDLWEFESHRFLPYSAPYVVNKVLGGRQEKGTIGNAQGINRLTAFSFCRGLLPVVNSPCGFIREKPTTDRPEEYHWTRNLLSDQKTKGLDMLSPGGKHGCSLLRALLFDS